MNPLKQVSIKRATDEVFLRSLLEEKEDLLNYFLNTPPKAIPDEKRDRIVWLDDQIEKCKERLK